MEPVDVFETTIFVVALIILVNSFISVAASVMSMVASMSLLNYARREDIILQKLIEVCSDVSKEVEHSRRMRGAP